MGILRGFSDLPSAIAAAGAHAQSIMSAGYLNRAAANLGAPAAARQFGLSLLTSLPGSTPSSATTTPSSSSGLLTGAAAAANFVNTVRMGMNIERNSITQLQYQGVPIYQSPAYFAYLKSYGIDRVRLFPPFTPSIGWNFGGASSAVPPASNFAPFITCIQSAHVAGVAVHIDLMDATQQSDLTGANGTASQAWVTQCCNQIAQAIQAGSIQPNLLAVGPFNEREFSTNASLNAYEQQYLGIIDGILPNGTGVTLVTGSSNYDYYGNLFSTTDPLQLFPRQSLVAQIHAYDPDSDTSQVSWWQGVASQAATWSAANGNIPAIWGESGTYYVSEPANGQQLIPLLWAGNSNDGLPGVIVPLAQGGGILRPQPWAITNGAAGQMNIDSNSGILDPGIAQACAIAANYIASQPYYTGNAGQIALPAAPAQSVSVSLPGGTVTAGQVANVNYSMTGADGAPPNNVNYLLFAAGFSGTYGGVQAVGGSSGTISITTQNSGDVLVVWPSTDTTASALAQAIQVAT